MIKIIKDDKFISLERDGITLHCPDGGMTYCCNACPFFDHRPKTPGFYEGVVLKCRDQEITFCEGKD